MNQLKDEINNHVEHFMHDLMGIVKEAQKNGTLDVSEIVIYQSTLNKNINKSFNEYETRKNRKTGMFGR